MLRLFEQCSDGADNGTHCTANDASDVAEVGLPKS
jgi:hypothetical protein